MTAPNTGVGGWTAGPWRISPGHPTHIIDDLRPICEQGVLIASACGHPNSGFFPTDEQAEANAARIVYAVNHITAAESERDALRVENRKLLDALHEVEFRLTGKEDIDNHGNANDAMHLLPIVRASTERESALREQQRTDRFIRDIDTAVQQAERIELAAKDARIGELEKALLKISTVAGFLPWYDHKWCATEALAALQGAGEAGGEL